MPHIKGNAAQVWWAYNSTKSPDAFYESVTARGIQLVRITEGDAHDSKTHHWTAKRFGRYSPTLTPGEYVVVNDLGQAYRLNDRSLGHALREVKAFMSRLDDKPMPSLREALNAVEEKRIKGIIAANRDGTERGDLVGRSISPTREVRRTAGKLAAGSFQFVANGFEALFARTLTPEERKVAEILDHERQRATERGNRQRGDYERGR
jgi:hypothetical protein